MFSHTSDLHNAIAMNSILLNEKVNQTFFSPRSTEAPSWYDNASNKNYDNLSNSSLTALIRKAWGYTLFDHK